jgi:two-component system KDP operon response regulator KdpE
MAIAGSRVPHAKLLRLVWGPEYENELEYAHTFIRKIRMKIEDDPASPKYLLTDSHIGSGSASPCRSSLRARGRCFTLPAQL